MMFKVPIDFFGLYFMDMKAWPYLKATKSSFECPLQPPSCSNASVSRFSKNICQQVLRVRSRSRGDAQYADVCPPLPASPCHTTCLTEKIRAALFYRRWCRTPGKFVCCSNSNIRSCGLDRFQLGDCSRSRCSPSSAPKRRS